MIIDISVLVTANIPFWPGSEPMGVQTVKNIGPKQVAKVSHIKGDLHTLTHLDAPSHFVKDGKNIDQIPINRFLGACTVIDATGLETITGNWLSNNINFNNVFKNILFKTNNSDLWEKPQFNANFVALQPCAAQILFEHNFNLVGIDYLSIQHFDDGPETHQILLSNNIIILEGLNLKSVKPANYHLIALPLKLANAEASPCRAVLQPI